jgi:hypothetical protein
VPLNYLVITVAKSFSRTQLCSPNKSVIKHTAWLVSPSSHSAGYRRRDLMFNTAHSSGATHKPWHFCGLPQYHHANEVIKHATTSSCSLSLDTKTQDRQDTGVCTNQQLMQGSKTAPRDRWRQYHSHTGHRGVTGAVAFLLNTKAHKCSFCDTKISRPASTAQNRSFLTLRSCWSVIRLFRRWFRCVLQQCLQ